MKKIAGAKYFALAILACLIWDFANIFEFSFTGLPGKILFEKIAYLGAVTVANYWFLFALSYSQKHRIKKYYGLLWIIPIITIAAAWTNEYHHLIWPDAYLEQCPYGITAVFKHGILFYISLIYSYILLLTGMIVFIKDSLNFPRLYRAQSLIIILVVLLPWASDILYIFGVRPMPGLDPETFTYTISIALIIIGYFRHNMLEITPIARDLIADNIIEGIVVTDNFNRIVEANLPAGNLFNHKLKNGINFETILSCIFPGLLTDYYNDPQEALLSECGQGRWFEVRINRLINFRGNVLGKIFMFHEITQRKRTEEILRESEKRLNELNEVKNRFFSIISHDLRSPFSGLIGYMDILKEDFNLLSDNEKETFIKEIDVTAKNIYGFLDDLLEWSRLNMGTFKIEVELLNLYPIVDEIINLMSYNARRKNIRLLNNLPAEANALGDPDMVRLLLRNLLSNAIKFSNKGGDVNICSRMAGSNIEICVADTGIGIPEEAIPKLFRLDIKYTTTGTADERGSGIGLALCKEILDKLNGIIRVESSIGRGSKFTFILPVN